MSGLQTIVDKCQGMEIDRRKVVGIQTTRNEVARTSETPTFNPWRINLTMPASLRYNEARALMEQLDVLDRNTPQVITFGNASCLSWIFRYQASLATSQLNQMTVQSFIGNQLVLTNLPAINANRIMFEQNDLIQIGNYTFPSTTQVTRGTGATVTITTHRPNIISGVVDTANITVGNACQFYMFCPNMPTYKLYPGGADYSAGGTLVGNALIEFSGDFSLYEWVATA